MIEQNKTPTDNPRWVFCIPRGGFKLGWRSYAPLCCDLCLELPQALLNQDDWLNWHCRLGCGADSFEGGY